MDAASVLVFADRSRGNALYVRELATGAVETGALAEQGGIWRSSAGGLRPTARLAELVALRLGDLSDAERTGLELLALCEPLGQARLDRLADPAALEALERKGLIASRRDGRRVEVRLAHPVYGDVVRAGITPLRERALARSLAEAVEATGSTAAGRHLAAGVAAPDRRRWQRRAPGGRGDRGAGSPRPCPGRAVGPAAMAEGGGFEARLLAAEAGHSLGRPGQAEHELDDARQAAAGRSSRHKLPPTCMVSVRTPASRLDKVYEKLASRAP